MESERETESMKFKGERTQHTQYTMVESVYTHIERRRRRRRRWDQTRKNKTFARFTENTRHTRTYWESVAHTGGHPTFGFGCCTDTKFCNDYSHRKSLYSPSVVSLIIRHAHTHNRRRLCACMCGFRTVSVWCGWSDNSYTRIVCEP